MSEKQAVNIRKYLKVAHQCLASSKYDEALAHFICLCNIQPSLKVEVEDEFMTALCKCVEILEHQQQYRKIVACFQEAAILFPNNKTLLNNIGGTLFRLGLPDEAASFFRQALQLNPENTQAKQCLDNISNSLVERWHFRMLNDRGRNISYKQAITKAIAKGYDTVLDIGSGSGILSMFAVQAGANKVYACELSKTMFEVSQDILSVNGMRDAIQLVNKKSTDIVVGYDIPSKVNLVVTETMDCGLLGEGILKTITHAWQSLLLPTINTNQPVSKVIPCAAKLYGMAISAPDVRNQCQSKLLISGINMNNVNIIGGDELDPEGDQNDLVVDPIEPYTTESINQLHHGYTALSNQFVIAEYDFSDPESLHGVRKLHFDLSVIQDGSLDAIAVWFDLKLDEDITISTGPNDGSLCWEQAVFPVFPHHMNNPPLSVINNEVHVVVNKGDTILINGIIDHEFLKVQCSEICFNTSQTNVLKEDMMDQSEPCAISCLHRPSGSKQETCPNKLCPGFVDHTPKQMKENDSKQSLLNINDFIHESNKFNGQEIPRNDSCLISISNEKEKCTRSQCDSPSIFTSDNQSITTVQPTCSNTERSNDNKTLGAKANEKDMSKYDKDKQYSMDITARKQLCQAVIPHAYMSRVNDIHYLNAYNRAVASAIENVCNHNKTCQIIEHSLGLPLLSLITAKRDQNTSMLVTNPVISMELLEQMRHDNDVLPKIQYGPSKLEDIAQQGRCWDVFVTDLIEPSGIIRYQGLEDIVFSRGCILGNHGVTIPAAVQALSMCIESDTLMSLSKVQNNDNTLGLNIGYFMNQFKVSNQININMATLKFKPLTEHFTLFTMDFMSNHKCDESLLALLDHTCEVQVKVINRGIIHALPYWFDLHLDRTTVLSTYSNRYSGSHWKQAVYILDEEICVEEGDEIIINVTVRQSCISMKVKKV